MSKLAFWISAVISGLYTAFVGQCLWNWFIVPVFHTAEISFWMMFGLIWVFSFFLERSLGKQEDIGEKRWKNAFTILLACLPESKEEEVKEYLHSQKNDIWTDVGFKMLQSLFGNTLTLLLGWSVYTFLI